MTWLELVQTEYTIITGDGLQWTPKWLNAQSSKGFNYTEFLFVGVKGSLVSRQLPRGTRYPIEIYFDGDTCITDGLAFYKSADNPKAWTILHPYYGKVLVQPLDISIDNSIYNVSKITCTIVETLGKAPANTPSPQSVVIQKADALQRAATQNYQAKLPKPAALDYASQELNVTSVFDNIKSTIKGSTQYQNFVNAYNAFNQSVSTVNDAVNQANQAIGYANFLCSMPANFIDTVVNRFAQLHAAFVGLALNVVSFTQGQKLLYESLGGVIQGAFCLASVTNITTDYDNTDAIYITIGQLVDNYNAYMANLDLLQSPNGGQVGAYIPTPDNIQAVTDLFLFTTDALFDLAANAKVKHTIYLPEASNLLLVAYTYLGLQTDDSTIDAIISLNNITLEEYKLLPKGRKIIYYI